MHQLIKNGAHTPKIRLGVVLPVLQYFRSHVKRRATHCESHVFGMQVSCKPKVRHLQDSRRSFAGQQQILWFQIPLQPPHDTGQKTSLTFAAEFSH